MKILQINKYSKLKGGTETVLFNTISLLKEQGHEVFLLASDGNRKVIDNNFYYINFPELRAASFIIKIKKILAFIYNNDARKKLDIFLSNNRPDIIHIHLYLNSFSVSILSVIKKHNIPVVITLHDYRQICPSYLFLDRHGAICEKCKYHKYYNCLLYKCPKGNVIESLMLTVEMYFRKILFPLDKYIDEVLFVSQFSKEKHSEYYPKLTSNAELLYNSVKEVQYLEYPRGDYYLYYGRLSREKGIMTLIEAARELKHILFKIVGEGDFVIDNKYIPSNVAFLGFKSGDDLKDLITHSAFVIVPSECYETFGLTVLESFSYSKPVIGAKIGAIPELIQNNYSGLLFKSGSKDSLVKCILDADIMSNDDYKKMCINANKRASFFSEQKYINNLLRIYHKAIDKHK